MVVIRGDKGVITIGERTNIQDGCVLHADPDAYLTIGNNVTIGHGAIVHGCTVADQVLIGMGAIILNHAQIGAGGKRRIGIIETRIIGGLEKSGIVDIDEADRAGEQILRHRAVGHR